jgi:ComF family protein
MTLQSLFKWQDLILQSKCLLCDRANDRTGDRAICNGCHAQITPRSSPLTPGPLATFAWAKYQDALRRLLFQLKYTHKPEIGDFLGQQLAIAWLAHNPARVRKMTIVPIPLHADRQTQRGYNQAELIARSFARFTGARLNCDYLQRQKATMPQHELNQVDRGENLANAFHINPQAAPRQPILIIDDIYTTGTTVMSATKTMQQSGATVWGVAVVAR